MTYMSSYLKFRSRALAVFVLSIGLANCASQTMEVERASAYASNSTGFNYFLPKSMVSITVSRKNGAYSIETPTVEHHADPNRQFRIMLRESVFSKDKYTLALNDSFLLSSANNTAKDETPEIIAQLPALAEQIGEFRDIFSALRVETDTSAKLLFDPQDAAQVRYARRTLKNVFGSGEVKLVVKDLNGDFLKPTESISTKDEISDLLSGCNMHSICFSMPRPLLVEITTENSRIREVVTVADRDRIGTLDVYRRPCVELINNVSFNNGMMQKLERTKPSEVLGCISIPTNILKTAIGLAG